jgi:small subunit ribosomal protein S20
LATEKKVKKATSADKREKQSLKRKARNTAIKTAVKTIFKKATAAVQKGKEAGEGLLTKAASMIDKAVSKGVVHKNKAARKKSRLAKKVNKAKSAA